MAVTVILVLALVPKARSLYEHSLQKRLEAMDLEELATQSSGAIPFQIPLPAATSSSSEDSEDEDTDLGGADDSGGTLPESGVARYGEGSGQPEAELPQIKVSANEIWRFSISTESLKTTRPKIARLLEQSGGTGPEIKGIDAPGGVLFNALVAQSELPKLMAGLRQLTQSAQQVGSSSESPRETGFTWFKNISMKPISVGKTRVVIWLSQL